MTVILLAAGVGRRFGKMTKRLPKCLISIGKNTCLLSRYLESFRTLGLKKIVIVVGHEKEKIKAHCLAHAKGIAVQFVANPRYRRGSIVSLHRAGKFLKEDVIIMDADVYFPTDALRSLIRAGQKSAFLADKTSKSMGEEMMLMTKNGKLHAISKKLDPALKALAEATGIVKFSKKDAQLLKDILNKFVREKNVDVEYEEAYSELLKRRKIGLVPIKGFWSEMDFEEDRRKIMKHA